MKRNVAGLAGILILIWLDQFTKHLAKTILKPSGPFTLIPGVLELQYVENRGAAFGIMQNRQFFFILMTIVVLACVLVAMARLPEKTYYLPLFICMTFVAAGAVGNLIDRVLHHYVTDFIYFSLIDFPVFNVADIYVTCAAFALVVLMVFFYRDEDLELILKGRGRKKETEDR